MKSRIVLMSLLVMVAFTAMNCSLLSPGYVDALKEVRTERPESDVTEMLEKAQAMRPQAGNREGLVALIKAYEEILNAAPDNYEALVNLSSNLACLEICYHKGSRDQQKRLNYDRAIEYSIRAMAKNPDFKQRLLRGAPLWQACKSLTEQEMDAMVTYLQASVDRNVEFLGPLYLINYLVSGSMKNFDAMSAHMAGLDLKDPRNICYANYYRGVYLLGRQMVLGGDLTEAEGYMQKAIDAGGDPWTAYYGMYLVQEAKGDEEKAIECLHQVLNSTLPEDDWAYPWIPPNHEEVRRVLAEKEAAQKQGGGK